MQQQDIETKRGINSEEIKQMQEHKGTRERSIGQRITRKVEEKSQQRKDEWKEIIREYRQKIARAEQEMAHRMAGGAHKETERVYGSLKKWTEENLNKREESN